MNAATRRKKAAADAELVEAKAELADALKKQDEHHTMMSETRKANVLQAAVETAEKKVDEKEKAVEAATASEKAAADAELVEAKAELADALKKQDEYHKHLSETNVQGECASGGGREALKKLEQADAALAATLEAASEAEQEAAMIAVAEPAKALVVARKARQDWRAWLSANRKRHRKARRRGGGRGGGRGDGDGGGRGGGGGGGEAASSRGDGQGDGGIDYGCA